MLSRQRFPSFPSLTSALRLLWDRGVGIASLPRSPWTFGSVSFLLLLAGLMACYLPASRAARTDPIQVLRAE